MFFGSCHICVRKPNLNNQRFSTKRLRHSCLRLCVFLFCLVLPLVFDTFWGMTFGLFGFLVFGFSFVFVIWIFLLVLFIVFLSRHNQKPNQKQKNRTNQRSFPQKYQKPTVKQQKNNKHKVSDNYA